MDDQDTEGWVDLFDNDQSNMENKSEKKIKGDYEGIHLPASILKILTRWERCDVSGRLNGRLGLCPCDPLSFDEMFLHIWSESHVEQPSRLTSIINSLDTHFCINDQCPWKCLQGRMVTNEEIRLVHSERFLQGFLSVERGEIVDDIPSMRTLSYANVAYHFRSVGPIIARACRIAAGSVLNLISLVVRGEIKFGFAIVRPAGHHSSTDQVGTFCGLNSIAIGAVYASEICQFERILILDWDIHRSGGTEEILQTLSRKNSKKYRLIDIYAAFGKIFYSNHLSDNVFLIDMFNKNQIPGDKEYLEAFHSKILPDIIQFNPSLILVSAGFDGAEGESEECAQITPNGYFQMTKYLKELNIPSVFMLEGGYQLTSLVQSIGATFKALLD